MSSTLSPLKQPSERNAFASVASSTSMRGPLHTLWNTRLIGTYLRLRVGFLLAGVLALAGGAVLLGLGGVWGLLALFGLVLLILLALGFVLITR